MISLLFRQGSSGLARQGDDKRIASLTEPWQKKFEKIADELLSAEEHSNVKAMIRKIEGIEVSDDAFGAKVKVLKEFVKHHVKEEQTDLFPKCRQALGEEALFEIGDKLAAAAEKCRVKSICSPCTGADSLTGFAPV